ncbi:hypothetical protein OCK74_25830 [Chitinophagaceae bacterium LB-8]|uniref:Uncharacterized protein n=1 Tax=Paraflavisolibacter caeni TaxID=2982496 RepID=A0A9X2Y0T6_9BACT|nr:hypothetical protein [Paraflavisolibacter caeni]MCU7552565.1 hypothetical protein [Paraflavisolibacter caeni]
MNAHLLKLLFTILVSSLILKAISQEKNGPYILDMVHNNPGEPLTKSVFNDPGMLAAGGYTGQVINDFTFAHAAVTFKKLNPDIFPEGSAEWKWVMDAAERVRQNIKAAHKAGIKVYYFTDIIVLPKKLVELYRDEICDNQGRISFERPKTLEVHKIMLDELFETFPELDGLVIRTGETYLNNVPYHTGNNPITNKEQSHIKLLNLLREEVCVKRNKTIFYRTWSFGGMHENPDYYLNVVNQIAPHPQLIFSIKHTKGDYLRTFDFNPTLTLGNHPQIVEVQCQREYEGKEAYPNYVMNGVINGFEEYHTNTPQKGYQSLNDIKNSPNFKGVWSWSRGGGWVGPYITNEFWCKLNAYVISHWGANTNQTEEEVFNHFMDEQGIKGKSRKAFRELCLLSAQAVLRGHFSAVLPSTKGWTWWMRDEFLAGIDPEGEGPAPSEGVLYGAFSNYYQKGLLQKAVDEKFEAVEMWKKIVALSRNVSMTNKEDQTYVKVSSHYGLLLHQIIAEGWNIMAMGFEGDKTGVYNKEKIKVAIANYDRYWKLYEDLKKQNPSCATLYKPYAFVFIGPKYYKTKGMGASVDKYRNIVNKS